MDALLKRWWRNRKNGETKEVTLTVRQAAQHGWEPYDLPVVAQVVKPLIPVKMPTQPVARDIQDLPEWSKEPEPKEPENAALAPPTTPKPAAKKAGRKPKNPKPE